MEDREVWRLNLELLPLYFSRKSEQWQKERKIEFLRPLENEYPFKSQSNQVVDGSFNQLLKQENVFISDFS